MSEKEVNTAGGRRRIVAVVVVLLLLAGAAAAWFHYRNLESTDNAQIEGDIVPVAARVGGMVIEVNVAENQYVEAGAVLARLDPRDYQVALARAQAEVADAQANSRAASTGVPITTTTTSGQLDVARAAANAAEKETAALQSRVAEAEANYNRVAADLKRYQRLIEKDEISRQQYDAAVAAERAARATLDAAQAAVAAAASRVEQARAQVRTASTAPAQIEVTRARAGSAQANVGRASAALQMAQNNLDYTVIKAPVSGLVSKKSLQLGQVIQPGQPLMAIVPVENVWVVANFKETQLKRMKPGQPVKVHVDAYDRELQARIHSIGGATAAKFSLLPPENATGNYVKVVQRVPVKIVFEQGQDPQHLLRPGMSVVPTVSIEE